MNTVDKTIILSYYILEKETEFVTFKNAQFCNCPEKNGEMNQRHNFMEISWSSADINQKFCNSILETESETEVNCVHKKCKM